MDPAATGAPAVTTTIDVAPSSPSSATGVVRAAVMAEALPAIVVLWLSGVLALSLRLLGGWHFNICPAPIDSWNESALHGEIFHTDEERGRFARFRELGLLDMFRTFYPEQQAFSWWDYRGGAFHRRQGLRIDFLLGTESVIQRLRGVEIDREYRKKQDGMTPSDHAPVFADLD
jgi:hypothetical protein